MITLCKTCNKETTCTGDKGQPGGICPDFVLKICVSSIPTCVGCVNLGPICDLGCLGPRCGNHRRSGQPGRRSIVDHPAQVVDKPTAVPAPRPTPCMWKRVNTAYGPWEPDCRALAVDDLEPINQGFEYCPFCGKRVKIMNENEVLADKLEGFAPAPPPHGRYAWYLTVSDRKRVLNALRGLPDDA